MKTSNGSGAYHHGFFGRPTILMGPNDGKGGGGGGGDDGGDDGGEDGGINEDAFGKLFNKFFHKAFGEREKRLEQKLTKSVETTLGSKLDELMTKIGSGEGKPKPDDKSGEGQPNPGQNGMKLPPEIQAQLTQAAKDAKEARDLAAKYQREAEESKSRSRKVEERTQLSSLLNGAVKPALLDMVVSNLHGNLTRDEESGAVLWKNGEGELVPLKDGVTAWLKSDAGKEVAPPRQANGSGSSGGSGSVPTRPGDFTAEHLGNIISGLPR